MTTSERRTEPPMQAPGAAPPTLVSPGLRPPKPPPPKPDPGPGHNWYANVPVTRYVPGFKPSTCAPLFHNGPWPAGLDLKVKISGITVDDIDVTQMGLCGGMAFLTRDIFQDHAAQLMNKNSRQLPLPVAQHILGRLLDSFAGAGVARWLHVTQESDHETWLGGRGLFSETVDEARRIISVIDSGVLCPIGVVLVESFAPWEVFNNHVELVYGYTWAGSTLTLHVYDCNNNAVQRIDDITIALDISSDGPPAKRITTNGTCNPDRPGTVRGFFILPYSYRDPSPAYVDDAALSLITPPPTTMKPGGQATAVVSVHNTGTTRWTPGAGYRFAFQSPPDNTNWGGTRRALGPVAPEGSMPVDVPLTAPNRNARVDFQVQMMRSGNWFGSPSPSVWVQVGAPPVPKPPLPRPTPCDLLRERYADLADRLEEITGAAVPETSGRARFAGTAERNRQVMALHQLLESAELERRLRKCPPFPPRPLPRIAGNPSGE